MQSFRNPFPSILWLHQVSHIAQFRSCRQKEREDSACKVVMGQAWKWCTSLCPHCIVDSVTWPYPTAKETGKCNKLCAWKEEKVGFGEHTAITAPKTLACGLTFMSLNFLTYEMVKWEQYCLSHSVIGKNTFVKCLV